jgi:hypothetical protein
MEAPSASATSSTPAGRKKFEVLQVSFTQDATIRSVLQNVKLQSSHNKDSLASTCVGLCRPAGAEFVNSFSIKKYAVLQNELLLGIPSGLTAAQTARHSENMRKSTKLKALLQSMEIQKTIKSPRAKDTGKGASPEIAPPLSPSYVVYAGPKGSGSPGKDEGSGGSPTADLKALERTGSNLEVKEDRNYGSQVYGENTTGTKRGDELVGSTTFDKVQDKVSLHMSKMSILVSAFILTTFLLNVIFTNRMSITDLPGSYLPPGSHITHVSLVTKTSLPPPPLPPPTEYLKLSLPPTLKDAPETLTGAVKNLSLALTNFRTRHLCPGGFGCEVEPQRGLQTRIRPKRSKLTLTEEGELTLMEGKVVVWKQKGGECVCSCVWGWGGGEGIT